MREKIIDVQQLVELLMDYAGHTIAYIRTLTTPSFNKTSRVSGQTMLADLGIDSANVRKISLYSFRLGYNYRVSLENACDKAGVAAPAAGVSWWKHWVTPSGKDSTTIAVHKDHPDQLYVIGQLNQWTVSGSPKKETRVRSMYVDISTGKRIDSALLAPWKKPTYAKTILIQTLKLASIKRLAFQREVYNLA